MKITKHMQSCFLIETAQSRILIDPGYFVFGQEGKAAEDFQNIDLIVITHEHEDHFDWENVQKIIEVSNPIVLSTEPVVKRIKEKFSDLDCGVIGEGYKRNIKDVKITGSESKHGPLPTGKPAPIVSGAIIDDGITRFYTPGDSIVLSNKTKADVVATPICGQVVMNINQAKEELLKLMPKIAIPIHYDNDKYPVDVNDFVNAMEGTGVEVKALKNGEMFSLN